MTVAACGSRTGLLVPPEHDAGLLADVTEPIDAIEEPNPPDVLQEADAEEEPDGFVPKGPDVCPDAGSTLVYVITQQNELMSFYPPTATFTTIGTITCPDPTSGPNSMAVSRQGVAYVGFTPSGNVFRVSTRTAECGATPFQPGNHGFPLVFGMGFSADVDDAGAGGDAGETLYLAGDPSGLMAGGPLAPVILGALDTTSFATDPIGQVTPVINRAELTGTGTGDLFAFYPTSGGTGPAAIGQIDKTDARLLSSVDLPAINIQDGWAFAYWGGDFYTFTAPDGIDTTVQRYRPSDGSVVTVATLAGQVTVGAGVSTCAPQM